MAGSIPASPTVDAAVVVTRARSRHVTPWAEAWRRFRRHHLAVASVGILLAMILAVVFGPLLWRVRINEIDFAAQLQGPSWAHPMGTDDLGQDILARMLYGGRISLAVGLAAMSVSVVVGTIVGAIAGVSRGSVDAALVWLTDLFLSLPQLPVLLLLLYLFRESLKVLVGPELGIFILIVAGIGAFRWMIVARLVRAQFFALREKEFVEAARMVGNSNFRIMRSHLLPHLVGTIIVYGTLTVATNILFEAALSYLGVGLPLPNASWGNLLSEAVQFYTLQPWLMLWPGLAILLTTLAFNLLGDGLRDALDPRSSL
jgi:peptide/nickel transport system permease protein